MTILPNPISFEAAQEKFISYLKLQKRSTATITAYAGDLAQLKHYLLDHKITQATTVSPSHLQDFMAHLVQTNYTAKSSSRKLNSVKSFFKFLTDVGLVPVNPASGVAHPKYEVSSPRILTSDEYRNLRDACRLDIRTAAIVELLLQTGIRISELAGLHLEDIKKTEMFIRPLENNGARTVPLGHSAQSAVQNYLAIRPQVIDPHLFITKTGRPLLIRNIRTIIDRYFKQAGVRGAKVNDLRHTFIAYQLEHAVSIETISEIVGHRRLTSTQKYLDFVKLSETPTTTKLQEL